MAKKKVITTTEEVEETPQEEPDYKDVHNKDMVELVQEPVEEKEEDKEEETVVEDKATEPVVKEPKEPQIDPEQLKKEIAEETTNKIVEALKGKDSTQTEDNLNQYQKFAKDVWEKEGRNPTWDEVLPLIEEAAVQRLEAKQQQAQKDYDEQIKSQNDEKQKYYEQFNKEVEEELGELYNAGKLPKIKNAEDPKDTGIQAREALFQAMAATNEQRVKQGLQPIRSVSRIYANYYKAPNRQPAGENTAIINGRSSGASANDDDNYSYKDIHQSGWTSFFKRK